MRLGIDQLTPVERIDGLWWKREDLYAPFGAGGVNGGKLRQAIRLIGNAADAGATEILTAASVHSPQLSAAAMAAYHFGLPCTLVIGGKPSALETHENIRISLHYGAKIEYVSVAYNPMLQRSVSALQQARPGSYVLPYGIAVHEPAEQCDVEGFHDLGALQVQNLPAEIENLVMPCGSAHSAASVLHGLRRYRDAASGLRHVTLVAVGPDRFDYLLGRLGRLQSPNGGRRLALHRRGERALLEGDVEVVLDSAVTKRPGFSYGKTEKPRNCPIELHPRYESKVWNYVNEGLLQERMAMGPTCFWIVGAAGKLEAMTK